MDVAGAIFGAAGPQAELNLCVGTKNDDNAFRQNNRNVNEVSHHLTAQITGHRIIIHDKPGCLLTRYSLPESRPAQCMNEQSTSPRCFLTLTRTSHRRRRCMCGPQLWRCP
jgi:hypothetical protein